MAIQSMLYGFFVKKRRRVRTTLCMDDDGELYKQTLVYTWNTIFGHRFGCQVAVYYELPMENMPLNLNPVSPLTE